MEKDPKNPETRQSSTDGQLGRTTQPSQNAFHIKFSPLERIEPTAERSQVVASLKP